MHTNGADFPDDTTWLEYTRSGGDLSRSDWRRQHVDAFVEQLHEVGVEMAQYRSAHGAPVLETGLKPRQTPRRMGGMDGAVGTV